MNISTPYRGTIRGVPTGRYPNDLILEIPLLFTRVGTGPTGIVDVVAVKVEIGGVRYELSQDLTLHALSHVPEPGETEASIAGDKIRRRPAAFKPDENDNNPMVMALHAMPADADRAPTLDGSGSVPLIVQLHLLFTNLAPLPIEIRGEAHLAAGLITMAPRPARVTSPILTNANLIALAVVGSLLLLWHSYFNGDVYEQTPIARQMVPALLGSLVTFLGLSVGRIKGWLATLTDTLSVLEYPELHFNPALTRRLSSHWFSAGIGILALASMSIVGWHWSDEASTDAPAKKAGVYDTETGRVVESNRIYRRDLKADPPRFGVVCLDDKGFPAENPMLLAHFRGRAKEPVRFKVVEHDLFADQTTQPTSMEQTGEAWLAAQDLEGWLPALARRLVCEPAFSEPRIVDLEGIENGLVVTPLDTGDPLRKVFQVSREWLWQPADIMEGPIEDARRDFPVYSFSRLFEDRAGVVRGIEAELARFFETRDFEGSQSVVPLSSAIALSTALMEQMGDGRNQKKTLERAILIRSLWRASESRRELEAMDEDLRAIATTVQSLLASDLGPKVDRALFELLLELQAQNEGTKVLHRAAVASSASLPSDKRYPKLLDYLVHALALDAVKDPQFAFFRDEWPSLTLWAGPNEDFGRYLERREEGHSDPTLDFEQIKPRLQELESRIRSASFDLPPEPSAERRTRVPEPARAP